MQNFISKKLCWLMIFILIFMWSGLVEYKAFAQQALEPSPKELKQKADQLEKLFDALEEAMQDLPRDTFDPEAIIKKVGKNPTELFEWVRDNTYLVPYRGSLRGPTGVLMDRLGNSLDRALLLHDLLHLAGYEARLVHGTLSEGQVKELMKKIRSIPKEIMEEPQRLSSQKMDNLIEKYAYKYQWDQERIKKSINKNIREQEKLVMELTKRVKEQTSVIYQEVEKFRKDQNYDEEKIKKSALKFHWWVQLRKDDIWSDMDPALSNAEPGKRLTEVKNVYQPDNLEDDLIHRVVIRVFVEQWKNEQLKEHQVFEYPLKPLELFSKQVLLRHIPMDWPEDLNLLEDKDPLQNLKSAVLNQKEWLPILSVGSNQISSSSFKDTGEINDTPGKKSGPGVSGISRGILGGLSGKEEDKEDSFLTAEWIEYEIHSPEYPVQKIRRHVFDSIGPALRKTDKIHKPTFSESQNLDRNFALFSETEILFQVCNLSSSYLTYELAKNLLANRDTLSDMLRQSDPLKSKNIYKKLIKITPLPGPEYCLALARKTWNQECHDVYLDRPNILAYHRGIKRDSKDNLLSFNGFDIITNELAVHSSSKQNPFYTRLTQGVFDTNAEAFLLKNSERIVKNTANFFAKSDVLGVKWMIIQDPHDQAWKKAKLPEDVRIRIEDDLSNGYIVILPQKVIQTEVGSLVNWWRINSETGNTLGIGENGKGQGNVEYALLMGSAFIEWSACMTAALPIKDPRLRAIAIMECMLVWPTLGLGLLSTGWMLSLAGFMMTFAAAVGGLISQFTPTDPDFWSKGRDNN
jgi:hypothetical protein